MSYIGFESAAGRVEIGGRERARMGVLIEDLAWVMHSRGMGSSMSLVEAHQAKLAYRYGPDENSAFGERLGWVCLIGDDVMKLLAHIHGQCEIHGWVHPDDGAWFASLIDEAVVRGLLGEDGRGGRYGSWSDVAELARQSTTPMVSDYSVCESWPDPYQITQERPDLFPSPWVRAVDDADDAIDEAWGQLGVVEQQRIADEAIASCAPRWHPAEWGTHWSALVRGRKPWAEVAP